jgi:hypothetical protein
VEDDTKPAFHHVWTKSAVRRKIKSTLPLPGICGIFVDDELNFAHLYHQVFAVLEVEDSLSSRWDLT